MIKIFGSGSTLTLLVIIFFSYFLLEPIFSWTFIQNSHINQLYVKSLSVVIYGFVLVNIKCFRLLDKTYIIFFSILTVKLILESLQRYGTLFEHFELYSVLYPIIFALFLKLLAESLKLDLLEISANFYLFAYFIFMFRFGHKFSLRLTEVKMDDYGPFSGDTRTIHAHTIYMMIVPFLWYLNKYVHTGKNKFLFVYSVSLLIILIHQHRSVWISAIVASIFYFIITIRTTPVSSLNILRVVIISLTLLALFFVGVSQLQSDIPQQFSERFSEIWHPSFNKGTASFRIKQTIVYYKLFLQKPIFGWTFEGFELKNPIVDWWPPKTGQHFHVGYIEMLFYHGIVGLIFKYSMLIVVCIKALGKRLTHQSIILICFNISGLAFSFAFTLPLMFWGSVGLCLYYLDKLNRSS
jgi:hypothetical protein